MESEIPLSGTIPMGKNAANYWLALDNVQQLGDFDPDKFERLGYNAKKISLADAMETNAATFIIRPI